MRTIPELRAGFLSYFEEKGHLRLPPPSVIPPPEDRSTLFIIAGMQPLQRYFLGVEEPPSNRLTTVQKVMRAGGKHNDLDDVGRTIRHESFYEMLGNFSLGDYFKEGAVELAWEFVTERLGLEPGLLWATVFAGDPELGLEEDQEAVGAWLKIGMPRERIVALPRSDNFWQAAETGPCGPNSELFYDRGEEHGCGRPGCAPGCECDRFLEFWNLVFMEFELKADGSVVPLPNQNVDTGLGTERTAMLLQDVGSVFETDVFDATRAWVEAESGVGYGDSEVATVAHRVLCDHSRAMTFLVAEGVTPSNEGRGYVLRRVIRRAVQHGSRIGLESPFLARLSNTVIETMGEAYPEIVEHRDRIHEILGAEEDRFSQTLERGMRLFEEVAARGAISGEDAFRLHDTYGFPLELTRELAADRGLAVDEEEFTQLMAEQRERSRAASAFDVDVRVAGPPTEFVGYEKTEVLTAITALEPLEEGLFQAKLERSPFYPEGGGQVSDIGFIENEETGARAELVKAIRHGDDQVLTFQGEGFAAGDRVRAVVPWSHRFPTMANHTATHLLHKALQRALGDHVRQAGSAVRPDKLRFDFTHPQALSPDERAAVERIVNEKVFENLPVHAFVTPIEEARKLGAMMLFGEKYGDEVRVVEIPGFSRELCGGTHVRWTAEIGPFVIQAESSVGAGTRRIEAITAGVAYAYLRGQAEEAEDLRGELERVRTEARKALAAREADVVLRHDESVDGFNVVIGEVTGGDLLDAADRLKQQHSPAAVVLGLVEGDKVSLVAMIDPSLEAKLSAVDWVKAAAGPVGGGGGGRPTMARAGGKNPDKLPEALDSAWEWIKATLA